MSVLGVSGPPPEIPRVVSERDKSDRSIVVIVIILVIVVVVGGFGTIFAVSAHYIAKFSRIDRSHESLSWEPNLAQANSTTFDSPGYGVSLKLPGKWELTQVASTDICHLLRADRRFNVLVRPYFPSFAPPGGIAAQIAQTFQLQGWILKGQNSITVSGLPAEEIQFVTPKAAQVDELVIQKVPVVYFVAVSGPASDADSWEVLRGALPQAISIRLHFPLVGPRPLHQPSPSLPGHIS
jgi:hypothetical protein